MRERLDDLRRARRWQQSRPRSVRAEPVPGAGVEGPCAPSPPCFSSSSPSCPPQRSSRRLRRRRRSSRPAADRVASQHRREASGSASTRPGSSSSSATAQAGVRQASMSAAGRAGRGRPVRDLGHTRPRRGARARVSRIEAGSSACGSARDPSTCSSPTVRCGRRATTMPRSSASTRAHADSNACTRTARTLRVSRRARDVSGWDTVATRRG